MKKLTGNKSAKMSKCRQNGVPQKLVLCIGIIEHNRPRLFGSPWATWGIPGSKGIPKAFKRRPEGSQKVSRNRKNDDDDKGKGKSKGKCEGQGKDKARTKDKGR